MFSFSCYLYATSLEDGFSFSFYFRFNYEHDFEACGKYPNLGPNSHNWSHQYFNPGIQPDAVRSSAYVAAFDVPSE